VIGTDFQKNSHAKRPRIWPKTLPRYRYASELFAEIVTLNVAKNAATLISRCVCSTSQSAVFRTGIRAISASRRASTGLSGYRVQEAAGQLVAKRAICVVSIVQGGQPSLPPCVFIPRSLFPDEPRPMRIELSETAPYPASCCRNRGC